MYLIVYQKKSIKSSLFEKFFQTIPKQEKQSNTETVLFRMKGIEFPHTRGVVISIIEYKQFRPWISERLRN